MCIFRFILPLVVLLGCAPLSAAEQPPAGPIDYNRQVRSILSDKCLKCHGPDEAERQGELRLDVREKALAPAESGKRAIVPGKSAESELTRRIDSTDDDERMPPPSETKQLSQAEKELLKRWIDQGAQYQLHWAFVPPVRPPLPTVKHAAWPRNPIDHFILAKLEHSKLAPSPEADRTTLIRRLSFDLTGLPPTLSEIDQFLTDDRPDAYERLVERLLSSPRFGERMALDWLDAARFADTHGYHIDSGRDMTRWREWVIDAFNQNKPFDEFTIEQLAGDLLPGATLDQKVASGFQRNHMINFEGGAIAEEYHNAYIVDRVNTLGTVWLGLTVACTQCHDHKYDPMTQREFYQLYAFFHNVPENGLDGNKGNAWPLVKAPTKEQQAELDRLAQQIAALQAGASPPADEIEKLQEARKKLEATLATAMVMAEMPKPRETFVLVRGQYDKRGRAVSAGVPAFLPSLPAQSPPNRLGLARWLVDPAQPLTARVTVNRFWQTIFGMGLVKTSEDFGSQGELPSHPELLDWLAVEFREAGGGWNVKRLVRLIVTSAAYRQSSAASPELRAKDPDNRLLARGSRFRLQAELIRDQALAASGLLNGEIGGRSVSPYQPPGIWEELASREDGKNWTAQSYEQSHGRDLYRRTMYTFWKRTAPPPSLLTFDAPDRETCTVRRLRTNTPLQALVLLNDPTYVEASRKLAERLLREAGPAVAERAEFAFRLATARRPTAAEASVLAELFERQLAAFRADPQSALRLLAVGESPRDERLDPAELAAWATVAAAILNLDETLTKG